MEQSPTAQLSFDFDRVQPHFNTESPDDIKLTLGEFSGPLDLLLFLIKQEQANIFDIPIAKIADEYLKYIRLMKTLDISLAADFIVMAATLIEIKSRLLLPREVFEGVDEAETSDPRQELIDRLLEHQKFKNAAEMLYERSTVEQAVFRRGQIADDENNSATSATIFQLLAVFQKVLERRKEIVQMEIHREEISLAEMMKHLRKRIYEVKELDLLKFFAEMPTRRELVTAFLAVLEIVRTESVVLMQNATFGEIFLQAV